MECVSVSGRASELWGYSGLLGTIPHVSSPARQLPRAPLTPNMDGGISFVFMKPQDNLALEQGAISWTAVLETKGKSGHIGAPRHPWALTSMGRRCPVITTNMKAMSVIKQLQLWISWHYGGTRINTLDPSFLCAYTAKQVPPLNICAARHGCPGVQHHTCPTLVRFIRCTEEPQTRCGPHFWSCFCHEPAGTLGKSHPSPWGMFPSSIK